MECKIKVTLVGYKKLYNKRLYAIKMKCWYSNKIISTPCSQAALETPGPRH